MNHIFISYSHKDKAYVHKLHRALIEKGFDAWIDDRIDYGARWPREIEKRLQECSAFILVMSPDSNESDWVQNELHTARELKKPILPLLLEGKVWWHLQTTQFVDVKDGKLPPANFFVSLASAVARHESSAGVGRGSGAPHPTEKPKNEGLTIHVVGDVGGNIIIGDQNAVGRGSEDPRAVDAEAEKIAQEKLEQERVAAAREKAEARRILDEEAEKERLAILKVENERIASTPRAAPSLRSQLMGFVPATISGKLTVFLFFLAPISVCAAIVWSILISQPAFVKWLNEPIIVRPTPTPALSLATTSIPASSLEPTLKSSPVPTSYPTGITQKNAQMLLIPAGTFTMGSDSGGADEKPPHSVSLDAFYIDQFEVTNTLYKDCVDAGGCSAPAESKSYTRPSYYGNGEFYDFPVIYVSWNQAKAYCEWRGARLPTEAEWEYAARGADGRVYPWGEGIDKSRANYYPEGKDTSAVGSYKSGKSPFDVYDMAGNVWEWVNDWYDEKYYQSSPAANPPGPTTGQYRVQRGGAWFNDDSVLRSAQRGTNNPTDAYYYLGLRCALSP